MTFAQFLEKNELGAEADLKPRALKLLRAQFEVEIAAAGDDTDLEADGDEDDETPAKPARKSRAAGGVRARGDDGASMGQTLANELKATAKSTHKRLRRLDELRAQYKTDDAKLRKEFDDLIEAAIDDDDVSLDKLELTLMQKHRPAAVKASGGGYSSEHGDVVASALLLASGLDEKQIVRGMDKAKAELVMNQATSADFQGFGLHDLCMFVIRAAGREYRGSHGGLGMLSLVRECDAQLRATGMSMLSLPYVLGNIANKSMLPAFENAEVVWPKLASVQSRKDFKESTSIRFVMDAEGLKKVGKDGKLQHLSLADSKKSYSLSTRGGILAITREDYKNDDMGVFTTCPALMGDLFAVSIEEEFFDVYINRSDWITSGTNQNYMEGAGTALDIAALKDAHTYWGNKVKNGRAILAAPKYLVVGVPLKVTAEDLYKEKFIQPAATKNTNMQFPNNPYVGLLEPVVSPYLSNTALRKQETGAALSGQSSTQWFLQADPRKLPAQIVGFLDGRRAPYVEVDGVGSWDSQFDVLGCQMRIFGDYGIGEGENDGIFKSKGAA